MKNKQDQKTAKGEERLKELEEESSKKAAEQEEKYAIKDLNVINQNARFWEYDAKVKALKEKYCVKNQKGEFEPPLIPTNANAAFQLFVDYYAQAFLETEKYIYIDHREGSWHTERMERELAEIETWIEKALAIFETPYTFINPKIASYPIGNIVPFDCDAKEYYLLRTKHYEDYATHRGYIMTSSQLGENSIAARVYGRYFLFRDFLIEKLGLNKTVKQIKPPTTKKIRTLESVWEKSARIPYTSLISILQADYHDDDVEGPFIKDFGGVVKWAPSGRGAKKYLQAVIWFCVDCNCVSYYSGGDWKDIVQNTFNVSVTEKYFESIQSKLLKKSEAKYFKPFESLFLNRKAIK